VFPIGLHILWPTLTIGIDTAFSSATCTAAPAQGGDVRQSAGRSLLRDLAVILLLLGGRGHFMRPPAR
jgi:hypothetical protein